MKENNDNFSNPKNIQFLKYLTKDVESGYLFDNAFSIFKSINNILYLIYSNVEKSIIIYDLINNRKIIEIKNAHKEYITNIKHCFDKKIIEI